MGECSVHAIQYSYTSTHLLDYCLLVSSTLLSSLSASGGSVPGHLYTDSERSIQSRGVAAESSSVPDSPSPSPTATSGAMVRHGKADGTRRSVGTSCSPEKYPMFDAAFTRLRSGDEGSCFTFTKGFGEHEETIEDSQIGQFFADFGSVGNRRNLHGKQE